MNIALLNCGLLGLLLICLSFTVSMARLKAQTGFGFGEDSKSFLSKAIRAQGNAAEYVPAFIVLILILSLYGAPGWANWLFFAATLSRYLHAAGMLMSSNLNNPQALRFIGSVGTYLCGFLLSGLVIAAAFDAAI